MSHEGAPEAFEELLGLVLGGGERFGHRQHVQVTWLAVRRHGVPGATRIVGAGLARTARYAGAPQKYHETMSRAWVELVGHHVAGDDAGDFDTFAERFPALLDKRLLGHFYRSSTLAAAAARTGWVEPDLRPLPGHGP